MLAELKGNWGIRSTEVANQYAASRGFAVQAFDIILSMILPFVKLHSGPKSIKHENKPSGQIFDNIKIIIFSKAHDLKARAVSIKLICLKKASLPAFARAKGGSFSSVARVGEDQALSHDLRMSPQKLRVEELYNKWMDGAISLERCAAHLLSNGALNSAALFQNPEFLLGPFVGFQGEALKQRPNDSPAESLNERQREVKR